MTMIETTAPHFPGDRDPIVDQEIDKFRKQVELRFGMSIDALAMQVAEANGLNTAEFDRVMEGLVGELADETISGGLTSGDSKVVYVTGVSS